MKNFRRIGCGIDPVTFIAPIAAVEGIWHEQTGRQVSATVQREAIGIPARGLRKSAPGGRARHDVPESCWTRGSVRLPKIRRFLEFMAESEDSILGRARTVSLPSGNKIHPRIDRGGYYRVRSRYHLIPSVDRFMDARRRRCRAHDDRRAVVVRQ